ncbi:CLUMA_CG018221, isoform A [Clunio marinus]|uniref:UDP-N-acetylglucosamine transferase subunit ALG13 n=1 Tax=Clunio marinus TaxID=568069 RepID=A0A1J1IYR3_9DIPT|nr:CLUMA_CG018221, isoform A [Clunio marinus]
MKFETIFVTVGTTEFNDLIRKLSKDEVFQLFKEHLGCKNLTIQIGKGESVSFDHFKGIEVEIFDLKKSILEDIEKADLVISHAGAGTCIDVLKKEKPLIVVINDTLMNNHQIELAEQLSADNYLFHTSVKNLPNTLKNFDISLLKKYEKGNIDGFIEYLDDVMGFAEQND